MTIQEKLASLRKIMERESLDAYIVSGTDPHNSEYLPECWRQRKWISGFTGSYGTVVVTPTDAGLWTDTRYFIQADRELAGTGIGLHKLRIPGAVDYPEWLAENLKSGARVGVDSFCMTVNDIVRMEQCFASKNIRIIEKTDLLGEIWLDRPALPEAPVFLLEERWAGASAAEKIIRVQEFLAKNGADYALFSSLDEIAWLYNIRGNDIPYNPIVVSYAVVGKEKAWWFVKTPKISPEVRKALETRGIEIRDYHHLGLFLDEIEKERVFCLDTQTLNYAIYNKVKSSHPVKIQKSPVILWKALKNSVELEGFRKACVEDGVAMTRFLFWLENHVGKQRLTETEVADKLTSLRSASPGYVSDSFQTISAYGANAALPHYSAVPGNDAELQKRGLYLVDSGAQYRYGTTDITRTIPLGELSELEKEDYTLVLKGMIALTRSVFPQGTTGANIDIVARQPLWNCKRNYGHGTGHGIGHFLCVHEGPQDIRQTWRDQPLLPGMVTSDEPGMYREGSHGIRHENMIVCLPAGTNEFGDWLKFETLTLCHFDTSALSIELMSQEDKEWLNAYHRKVYEELSPFLQPDEASWLKMKTKEI